MLPRGALALQPKRSSISWGTHWPRLQCTHVLETPGRASRENAPRPVARASDDRTRNIALHSNNEVPVSWFSAAGVWPGVGQRSCHLPMIALICENDHNWLDRRASTSWRPSTSRQSSASRALARCVAGGARYFSRPHRELRGRSPLTPHSGTLAAGHCPGSPRLRAWSEISCKQQRRLRKAAD